MISIHARLNTIIYDIISEHKILKILHTILFETKLITDNRKHVRYVMIAMKFFPMSLLLDT